jgi:hypothetical protein
LDFRGALGSGEGYERLAFVHCCDEAAGVVD